MSTKPTGPGRRARLLRGIGPLVLVLAAAFATLALVHAPAVHATGPAPVQGKSCMASSTNSLTCTFTSSVTANDMIFVHISSGSAGSTTPSATYPRDSFSSTFLSDVTGLAVPSSGGWESVYFGLAASSGSDTVTIHWAASSNYWVNIYEYSGLALTTVNAVAGTISHSSGTGSSSSASVTSYRGSFNPSHPADSGNPINTAIEVVSFLDPENTVTCTAGSGYTIGAIGASGGASAGCDEYSTSTISSTTTSPMTLSPSTPYGMISEGFETKTVSLTATATFSNANGGSQQTVSVLGCSPSPSTFTGDGSGHAVTLNSYCLAYLSLPSGYTWEAPSSPPLSSGLSSYGPGNDTGRNLGVLTCTAGTCIISATYEAVPSSGPYVVQGVSCVVYNSATLTCPMQTSVTSGDLLVAQLNVNSGAGAVLYASTITDTVSSSFTYDRRGVAINGGTGGGGWITVYYASAASTGSDTATLTFSQSGYWAVDFIEYHGLGTTSTGSNSAAGSGTSATVGSFTPSSSSYILAFTDTEYIDTCSGGAGSVIGFAVVGIYSTPGCDQISTSASGSATTAPMTVSSSPMTTYWGEIAEAFPTASVTVTGKCTMSPGGAAQDTVTLSGASVTPTTMVCDGNTHSLTANPSQTVTATVGSAGANQLYKFNPSGSLTTTVTASCASACNWFFHDYLTDTVTASYSGSVSSAPVLAYTAGGNATTYTLTGSGTNKQVDDGTSWTITKSGNFPSSNERYDTTFANSTASAGQTINPVFYHQWKNTFTAHANAQASFDTSDSIAVTGTYYGAGSTTLCTITLTSASSDSCTSFSDNAQVATFPASSATPPSNSRWENAAGSSSNTASITSGGGTFTTQFYKQWLQTYKFSISCVVGASCASLSPTLTYTSLGSSGLTTTETTSGQTVYIDATSTATLSPSTYTDSKGNLYSTSPTSWSITAANLVGNPSAYGQAPTLSVKFTPGFSGISIGVSGCSVNATSVLADGNFHFLQASPSCSVAFAAPAPTSSQRVFFLPALNSTVHAAMPASGGATKTFSISAQFKVFDESAAFYVTVTQNGTQASFPPGGSEWADGSTNATLSGGSGPIQLLVNAPAYLYQIATPGYYIDSSTLLSSAPTSASASDTLMSSTASTTFRFYVPPGMGITYTQATLPGGAISTTFDSANNLGYFSGSSGQYEVLTSIQTSGGGGQGFGAPGGGGGAGVRGGVTTTTITGTVSTSTTTCAEERSGVSCYSVLWVASDVHGRPVAYTVINMTGTLLLFNTKVSFTCTTGRQGMCSMPSVPQGRYKVVVLVPPITSQVPVTFTTTVTSTFRTTTVISSTSTSVQTVTSTSTALVTSTATTTSTVTASSSTYTDPDPVTVNGTMTLGVSGLGNTTVTVTTTSLETSTCAQTTTYSNETVSAITVGCETILPTNALSIGFSCLTFGNCPIPGGALFFDLGLFLLAILLVAAYNRKNKKKGRRGTDFRRDPGDKVIDFSSRGRGGS